MNLSRNLVGSLLFLLCSCAVNDVPLKELNTLNNQNKRLVLDVSRELQWDTHLGIILQDSVDVIGSVVNFLNANDDYNVLIKVYYTNHFKKHVISAKLMAANLKDAFLKKGISESRLEYDIAYDKNKTYVFYEKNQKVKIFFKR